MTAASLLQRIRQTQNLPTPSTTLGASQNPKSFSVSPVLSVMLLLTVTCGCASRQRVATRQPPPTAPASTPENTEAAAKNSSPPPPAVPRKRRKDNSIPVAPGYTEEGEASWYGAPFHGRQSSNGEIYDMNKLTAAHRTLPFETMVRVTNQKNGKSAMVRITDRGPFVNNRIIDLSYAAARQIESIGPGVVPVRVEVLSTATDPQAGFFTVQVGSFRDQANAERLRARLAPSYSPIFIKRYGVADGAFYRVHVGKVSGEEAAEKFGDELHAREGVVPMVIRLDENPPSAGEVQ